MLYTIIPHMLVPVGNSRLYYHDPVVDGLSVRIRSKGVKSFVVKKRINKKPVIVTLECYPRVNYE